MSRLVRAELLKLRTTRSTPAALLSMLVATVGWAAYTILRAGERGAPSLGTFRSTAQILTAPRLGTVAMLLLGAAVVTAEFRHHTAAGVFLVMPRRGRVIATKLVAVGLVGAGYALLAQLAVLAVALPWLTAKGVVVDPRAGDVELAVVGTLVTLPLYGLVGVAAGALLRNQLAAALVPLVWLNVVEPRVIDRLAPDAFWWVLSGASLALGRADAAGLLPQWAGGLLLLGYAVLLAGIGSRFVLARDVVG